MDVKTFQEFWLEIWTQFWGSPFIPAGTECQKKSVPFVHFSFPVSYKGEIITREVLLSNFHISCFHLQTCMCLHLKFPPKMPFRVWENLTIFIINSVITNSIKISHFAIFTILWGSFFFLTEGKLIGLPWNCNSGFNDLKYANHNLKHKVWTSLWICFSHMCSCSSHIPDRWQSYFTRSRFLLIERDLGLYYGVT